MDELEEILREFVVESYEGLDRMEQDLVVLEREPANHERLQSIFRAIHSIKSTCGFLGYGRLERLTHAAETVLGRLREGQLDLDASVTSALLALIDAVRGMLSHLEAEKTESDKEHRDLIEYFEHILEDGPAPAQSRGTTPTTANEPESAASGPPAEAAGSAPESFDPIPSMAESSIRVDVGLLDKLMNVVGELVLARNQILQQSAALNDAPMTRAAQRLNLITTELQEDLMKTRMQPISRVTGKFPRLVRDLEIQCGKKVTFIEDGGDTELDRTLLQAIKDPLTHLIRNAVDHGIEPSDERERLGKPERGTLRLHAFHESGYVIVEVSDDGAGINAARVRERAVSRGLIGADLAEHLSEHETLSLIFSPGFSTAAEITNISGRGVGMDVVRSNIERVGGSVDVQTRMGEGTTFKIKIPLTLAIVPALMIECGPERYAIPQVNLMELVRLEGEQIQEKLEDIQGALVYRLRGKLLPIVDLRGVLEFSARPAETEEIHIVILQDDDREFGLLVDAVDDTEEIVVKPLGQHIKKVECFASATIMGDGRVALILDVLNIAQRAQPATRTATMQRLDEEATEAATLVEDDALVLFRYGRDARAALPL